MKLFKKSLKGPGLAPGTLIHVGEKKTDTVKIQLIDYDASQFAEKPATLEECFSFKDTASVTWINISGIHQIDVIEKLGKHFGIHPLILEDILNTEQRPKLEDYDDHVFLVLKMLQYDHEKKDIKIENISVICGSNYVISFQESEGDVFEPIRQRVRDGRKLLRKSGSDYLAYALMDAIIDNYFIVLEHIGERIDELQKEIMQNPQTIHVHKLNHLQEDMFVIQKSAFPLRKIIVDFERLDSSLIKETTGIYLKDVYDHILQIIETIEVTNNKIASLGTNYVSILSNKTNEVMKTLALVATIFIPLTFIAGVYGMNFEFMPELSWRFGYPSVIILMTVVGSVLFVYFKKKNWL